MVRIMEAKGILPEHQFGFRAVHCTVEQLHRVVEQILSAFKNKEYCNALCEWDESAYTCSIVKARAVFKANGRVFFLRSDFYFVFIKPAVVFNNLL